MICCFIDGLYHGVSYPGYSQYHDIVSWQNLCIVTSLTLCLITGKRNPTLIHVACRFKFTNLLDEALKAAPVSVDELIFTKDSQGDHCLAIADRNGDASFAGRLRFTLVSFISLWTPILRSWSGVT